MSRLQDMANLYKGVRIYIFRGFLNIYIYIYIRIKGVSALHIVLVPTRTVCSF